MPKVSAKKTKAQKQIPIVAVISADGEIQGSFSPEPRRPLIAHLPFRSTEVQFQDGPLAYDPRPPVVPEPYEADDLYTSNAEILETVQAEKEIPSVIEVKEEPVKQEIKVFRTMDIMPEYHIANENKTLPESVDAACFWCAGCFEGRPIVIPSLEEHGTYKVYGNFCTLSCSLSYLLNEQVDPQVRWERQALLHRMYAQPEPIHPAPARESLRHFGGALSYEQYRDIIEKKKIRVDTHLPPVISILATLDTKPIDFYETSLRNTSAAGAGIDVVKTLEPGLRLKRSKPLKDKESTLDAVMNLHVKVKA
jgi:hypothetical protein